MKKWNSRTKEEKKRLIFKIIGGSLFLAFGTIAGFVSMYCNGWDFKKLLTDPTALLCMLVGLAVAIVIFTWKGVK